MTLAETAKLAVQISLDDKLTPGLPKANRAVSGLGSTVKTVGKGIGIGLGVAAVAGVTALTGAIAKGTAALRDDAVVAAQTAAVIKSTGGAAHYTAKQVSDLADKLSVVDGVSDNVVQNTENLLLTFTKIGGNVLPTATQAVLDMSAALGQDAKSSAIQLGKALNDPLKGITALQRVGVTFSADQKKQIAGYFQLSKAEKAHYEGLSKEQQKQYLKQHDINATQKAQAVILREVKKEFGGVAKAQADADPSRRLGIAVEKFEKSLAKGVLPVVEKVQTRLAEWLIKPSTLTAVEKIGDAIGGLFTDDNLDTVASGLETAANAVSSAIGAFNSLPGPIKALAIGAFTVNKLTGGAVGGLASGLGSIIGKGISSIRANTVIVQGGTVSGGGAGGGAAGGAGKIGTALAAASIVTSIASVIATQQEVSAQNSQLARDIDANLQSGINVKTPAQLQTALDGVNQGINDLQSNPLNVLVQGDALTTLQSMRDELKGKLANSQLAGEFASHSQWKPDSASAGGIREQIRILHQQLAEAKKEHNAKLERRITSEIHGLRAQEKAAESKTRTVTDHTTQARLTHLASLQARLHAAQESHDSGRAHRLQGKIDSLKSKIAADDAAMRGAQNRGNRDLGRIAAKKTSFKTYLNVGVSTSVSVRNVNTSVRTQNRYSSRTLNQAV